jgi:hypothetical protein
MGRFFRFKQGNAAGIITPVNRSVNSGKRTGGAGKKNNARQENPQSVFHKFPAFPLRRRPGSS